MSPEIPPAIKSYPAAEHDFLADPVYVPSKHSIALFAPAGSQQRGGTPGKIAYLIARSSHFPALDPAGHRMAPIIKIKSSGKSEVLGRRTLQPSKRFRGTVGSYRSEGLVVHLCPTVYPAFQNRYTTFPSGQGSAAQDELPGVRPIYLPGCAVGSRLTKIIMAK